MPLNQTPYRPEDVNKLYNARITRFMKAGENTRFPSADKDVRKTLLLIIDAQVDFVNSKGNLSVPGAVEDTQRLIEFIYMYTGQITGIVASLDTHQPRMIFFPSWWIDTQTGRHPKPFTQISADDVRNGIWTPKHEVAWSENYVGEVEKLGTPLIIWPYHTIENTVGQLLVPALVEAITYHSSARKVSPLYFRKGFYPKTEHYGIFMPEYYLPADSVPEDAHLLIEHLDCFDQIIVAGQAKSHCVLKTLKQMTGKHFPGYFLKKVTLLTDCTSSVGHPENLFEKQANEELTALQNLGLTLSTTGLISI